ncbi:hypothetical protein [Demequina aurantiaca]|uniref:hypothetical protein n=1 Tax=Demequina aurantiaca TaxID=676200 RepID=UPI003D327468
MTDLPASDALQDLMFTALDHGVKSASDGGAVIPFLVEEDVDGTRKIVRFDAGELQESVARAREAAAVSAAERVALCFDGYLTDDTGRFDAVYIVAQERGGPSALTFIQRYRPADAPGGFGELGNPAYAGTDDRLF